MDKVNLLIELDKKDYEELNTFYILNLGTEEYRKNIEKHCLDAIRQGKPYEPQGYCMSREALKEILTIQKTDFLSKSDNTSIENDKLAYRLIATGIEHALNCVNIIPTDEPERPQGKWESYEEDPDDSDMAYYRCSVCGRLIHSKEVGLLKNYPFCHCGAKMSKGGAEE